MRGSQGGIEESEWKIFIFFLYKQQMLEMEQHDRVISMVINSTELSIKKHTIQLNMAQVWSST